MSGFTRFCKHAALFSAAYALLSLTWIFLSDLAVSRAGFGARVTTAISIAKGCIFVIATAALIYYLLRHAYSEEKTLHALLQSAPDAMVIADRDGVIGMINTQTEKLFGYARAELVGQKVELLIPERFRDRHPRLRDELIASRRQRPAGSGLELLARRKDGSEFPAEISLSSVWTTHGLVVCSDIRDISERKRAEEQIRKLNSQLEEALRRSEKLATVGGLIATLAHEINNPLESLSNVLYLLKRQPELGTSSTALLHEAEQDLAQIMTLARQTLAPHRETRSPVPTKLSDLLDDVVALFDRKLKSAGVEVIHEYQSDGEVFVYPSDFRQVFTNLIANSIDAMAGGGTLRLVIEDQTNGEVVVRVIDTGCGISSEHLDSIFEPFYTTKGEKGTGIGLWVIRGIVEKAGGRIEVVSSVTGQTGTSFSILLPVASAVAAQKH